MPRLVHVVLVIEDYQALDDRSNDEGNTGEEDLPTRGKKPTCGQ